MRVNRALLALIAGVAVIALFIDGFAYIYRIATHQSLTGPINSRPQLSIPLLGFQQDIYVHKGLDLSGGTHLELQITNVRSGLSVSAARDTALAIIERRVNSSGYAESTVRPEGSDRIIVELPGVNLEQAKQILGKTSYLTIWKWVPGTPDAKTIAQLNATDANTYAGYKPEWTHIDGSMVTNASRSTDSTTNLPDVTISFNNEGSTLFCNFTRDRFTHAAGTPDNKLAIFIDHNLGGGCQRPERDLRGDGADHRWLHRGQRPGARGPTQLRVPSRFDQHRLEHRGRRHAGREHRAAEPARGRLRPGHRHPLPCSSTTGSRGWWRAWP